MKQYLDAGTPWPLGLIGMTRSPKDNHQVLAYGYSDNGDGTGTLYIYDNRRPDQECTITLDFNGQELTVPSESCTDVERGELKGFFCSSYRQNSPPAALGLTQGMVITPPPPFIPGQTVSITYTATNVGFGSTPPVKLYVRGMQRIRVDPHQDASPGALLAAGAGSNGNPPLFREQFVDCTSSFEENLQPAPIASAFSDAPPHGHVFGTKVSRQLAVPAQWSLPNDESTWSFSAEVLLKSAIDGMTSYKALPAVKRQDQDSKEKEKDGKDKEKNAANEHKDNKENLKESSISII